MKFIFKPIQTGSYARPKYDWYESTEATPAFYSSGAGFKVEVLREWMLQWVFK